jgi:hypothetical protein
MIADIPVFKYKKGLDFLTNNLSESKSELLVIWDNLKSPAHRHSFFGVYTSMLNIGIFTHLDVWA